VKGVCFSERLCDFFDILLGVCYHSFVTVFREASECNPSCDERTWHCVCRFCFRQSRLGDLFSRPLPHQRAERSFYRGAMAVKLGVALGGGGAKGIAHIGVLRVLDAAHVPISIVAGTSAGSIIGALYAAGKSSDDIERLMRRLSLREWLARDQTGMGLFSTDGIRRVIESELGIGARIENLPLRFAAIATEMESEKEVVFDTGLVADAVCASCAFPVVLAPAQFGGHTYLDGGLLNPVPFDAARRLGAECVLAVDLAADEPIFTANPALRRPEGFLFRFIFSAEQQKIFRVGARTIGIMTKSARMLKALQVPPDLVIYPDVRNIGLIDFDLIDLSLAAGEQAMRDALPQLEKVLHSSFWNRVAAGLTKFLKHRKSG
jgi:NTE family protein